MSKIFPKSANALPLQILIFLGVLGGIATAGINYYATPKYSRVGYQPVQPVPFEHSLHAGQLGHRADRRETPEFDPRGVVWNEDGTRVD